MNLPRTYIVYDLETTGLNYKEDEAVEIGALKVIDGIEIERRVWLLKPSVPMNEQASEITGITQELLDASGRDPKECWQEFAEFCGFTKDNQGLNIPIVGHNILRFDNLFMAKTLTALGYVLEGTTTYVDTAGIYKAEALKLEQRPGEPDIEFMNRALSIKAYGLKYNLGKVFEEYGGDLVALQNAHRVDGDITMTDFIYKKLWEKSTKLPSNNMPVCLDSMSCCGENMNKDGDRFICNVCGDVVSGYGGTLLFNLKLEYGSTKSDGVQQVK